MIDTDKEIEAAAGMAISDIFANQGEEAFRRLETGVLEKLLEQGGRSVISVGGGLPLRAETGRFSNSWGPWYIWMYCRKLSWNESEPMCRTAPCSTPVM